MTIRSKVPCIGIIPEPFICFMRDVAAKIEQRDIAAWMESDDLLQSREAYGGLYDEAKGRYRFECSVNERECEDNDAPDVCWYFDLDRQQIGQIANGRVTQLPLWRCAPDCGRRFPWADYYCPSCDRVD